MRKLILSLAFLMSFTSLPAQDYSISNPGMTPSERPGWVWESFADTVMGGKSELVNPVVIDADGSKALLLAGRVVTKGGGFIQVRLKYGKEKFDASAYSGVELEVDARSESSWYVFIRTKDNVFPWSYYGAPFKPLSTRSVIRIPWSAFKAESAARKGIRTEFVSSVAIVAAFEDFNAYMRIYRVAFYK